MYNFALSKDSNYPLGKINPLDLCIDSLFYEEKNSTKFSPGIKEVVRSLLIGIFLSLKSEV